MKPLTAKQRAVLDYLRTYIASNNGSPTLHEIAHHFGWASDNAAQEYLRQLQTKGYITLARGVARGIRIVGENRPDPARMAQALRDVIAIASDRRVIEICNAGLA